MSEKKANINSFYKGLYTDGGRIHQQEGTYTYALNAVNDSKDGNVLSLTNEDGNELSIELPSGYYPIGHEIMVDNEVVLFLKDDDGNSRIVYSDKFYNLTTLADSPCLNFVTQIDSEYRYLDGCDRIIYFVDGVNPDRNINIDEILRKPTSHRYLNENGDFDCSKLKDILDVQIPCITDIQVNNTGGNLKLGSYQIILKYLDEDLNATHNLVFSKQIPIVYGSYESDYSKIEGGDPNTYPTTTKSISIQVDNLDMSFKSLSISVGYTANGSTLYYEVDRISITSESVNYTLSTLQTDDVKNLTLDQIIVDRVPYEISQHNEQIDDRYIKANVKGKVLDFAPLYREANKIQTTYFTKPFLARNSNDSSGSPKTSQYYTDNRSYMRDEIYALYIVYVWKDGYVSPRIPIPGRRKNLKANGTQFPTSDFYSFITAKKNNSSGFTDTNWDTAKYQKDKDSQHLNQSDYVTVIGQELYERWKVYSTSYRETLDLNALGTEDKYTTGQLGYYESTYNYPDLKDCNNNPIYALYDDNGNLLEDWSNTPIRHHRMPCTSYEPHFTKDENGNEYILPLGLTFKNINIPAEYKDEIQGYYIVREKRNSVNKTVLDKGIVYNNQWMTLSVNDDVDEYSVQPTTFGNHRFHNSFRSKDRNGVTITNGFIPLYSSIDVKCGNTGFRDPSGNSNSSFKTVTGYNGSSEGNRTNRSFDRGFLNPDFKSAAFHGVNSKFRKTQINPSFLKIDGTVSGIIEQVESSGTTAACDPDEFLNITHAVDYNSFIPIPFYYNSVGKDNTNRKLSSPYVYINADDEIAKGVLKRNFVNKNSQDVNVFETEEDLPQLIADETAVFDGQTSNATYAGLKVNNNQMYGQLSSGEAFLVSPCMRTESEVDEFGGDTFINKFSFFTSSFTKFCTRKGSCEYREDGLFSENEDDRNGTSSPVALEKCLITMFVESEVNAELRHRDFNNLNLKDNTYWDIFNGTKSEFLNIDYLGNSGDNAGGTGGFSPWFDGTFAKNLYLYNEDYTRSNSTKPYFALDDNYDFCKPCNESFPTRLIYSEQSFQEERIDNYRIFQALNYRDLPASNGPISDLFINFDELYAHTSETLYKIFTKPYSVQTDQTNIYIGSGEFFSVPPKELASTDYGYLGSNQKWATKQTEFGTIIIDDITGKIFQLVGDKVIDLSLKGMRNWFEENIPLQFPNQFQELTGNKYSNNTPSLTNGIGFLIAYDPRFKRIIVTKKDYLLTEYSIDLYLNEELIYDGQWKHDDVVIDTLNPEYFENRSWTISYSFLNESWVSYHSYLPNYYFNDSNNFYSFNNGFWKHGERNFQTYYDVKHQHIIEFIVNNDSNQTKSFDVVSYISDVQKYNPDLKEWSDIRFKTFDKMIAYTSTQSTGLVDLEVKNTNDPFARVKSSGESFVNRTERDWKINKFRDRVSDKSQPFFSRSWEDLQTEYPIDKVINQDVFSNKSPFELQNLRDKYMSVRLFYTPEDDTRIITDITTTLNNISIR